MKDFFCRRGLALQASKMEAPGTSDPASSSLDDLAQPGTHKMISFKCPCCEEILEHRCPGGLLSDTSSNNGAEDLSKNRIISSRDGVDTPRKNGKPRLIKTPRRKKSKKSVDTNVAPGSKDILVSVGMVVKTEEGMDDLRRGDEEEKPEKQSRHTSAADYKQRLNADDYQVTDDGLDLWCTPCSRMVTRVALGQRIRIDNLKQHLQSGSHLRNCQVRNMIDTNPLPKGETDAAGNVSFQTILDTDAPTMAPTSSSLRVHVVSMKKPRRATHSVSPADESQEYEMIRVNSYHKSAADYVKYLQSTDLTTTPDGLDILCTICNKVLTKVNRGFRVRIDNVAAHLHSKQHYKASAKVFGEGGESAGVGSDSEQHLKEGDFPFLERVTTEDTEEANESRETNWTDNEMETPPSRYKNGRKKNSSFQPKQVMEVEEEDGDTADPEDDNASELAIGKESTSRDLDAEDYPAAVESAGPSLRKRKQRPMRHGFIY